jgi:predicted PurR-regulated permease PerM
VIENAKGYAISPWVEGEQLDIHPLLVFVAVLCGATLGGFAGAFIAVPLAAIIDLFVRDVVIPWRRRQVTEAPLPPPA